MIKIIASILISLYSLNSFAIYAPAPDLFTSPVLLINYKSWGTAYSQFNNSDTDTRAFRMLVEIIYDYDINRPWGLQYFPEATARLKEFQNKICTKQLKFEICTKAKEIKNENDLLTLKKTIQAAGLIDHLRKKWNLFIDVPFFPNTEAKFNYTVSTADSSYSQKYSFWGFPEKTVQFNLKPIILLSDVGTYLSGFKSEESPVFISYSSRGYLLNDWLMRIRAMEFGHNWKNAIERHGTSIAQKDPTIDAPLMLQYQLFLENAQLFETVYTELKAVAASDVVTAKRFLDEKNKGKYPVEVYQAIAYKCVKELIELQSAYFRVTQADLGKLSMRQRTLESLLTLQKYAQFSSFIKMELATRSVIFSTSAVALDQIADPMTTLSFGAEMMNLALQEGLYPDLNYFEKIKYSLLQDEIFAPHFVKDNFPSVWEEMKIDDTHLKSIKEFTPDQQLSLLRRALKTQGDRVHVVGLIRMYSAFLTKVSVEHFKEMAEIVQKRRMKRE